MSTARRVSKYEILEEIGRGSFGVVYKARDVTLGRLVALKVLHPQLATDPTFVARFYQEARAAANLDNTHIVTVYEVGEEAGQYYLAMAYLPGRTLDKWLAEGMLTTAQAVAFTQQIAGALDAIHEQSLVHRDVKPANIMVDDRGRATLLDFGIVRAAQGTRMTTTMGVLGTPAYMAPEQAEADEMGEIDWRADIYALAVVAYEMLVGHPPFTGASPTSILYKHVHEPPPLPTKLNPDLPPAIESVLLTALAKRRDERFQRASEMASALRRASVEVETRTRRRATQPQVEPQTHRRPTQPQAEARVRAAQPPPARTRAQPAEVRPERAAAAERPASPGKGFWLGWVAANTAGWIIGLVLGAAFLSALQESFLGAFLGAFLLGLSTGMMQWFVLRRHLREPGQWVWATAGGTLLGAFAAGIVGDAGGGSETLGLVFLLCTVAVVLGTCIGVAQWLVLRDQYRGAGWWVVANAAAWLVVGLINGGIGAAMVSGFGDTGGLDFGEAIGQIIAKILGLLLVVSLSIVVLTGPVSGAITGAALLRLLRQPRSGSRKESRGS
jgi:predicted Ser/Thr protein kinase